MVQWPFVGERERERERERKKEGGRAWRDETAVETTKRVAATTSNLAVRFSSAVTHAKHHTYHRHTTTTTNITPPPAMTMACGSGTRILPRPVYLVTAPRRWHRPRRRSRGGERRGRMCRRSRMMMMMMTMVMMERDMTRTSTTGTVRRGSFAAGGGEPGGGDGPGRVSFAHLATFALNSLSEADMSSRC